MTLSLLIVIPLIAAAIVVGLPAQRARTVALIGTLLPMVPFGWMLTQFVWREGERDGFREPYPWFKPLGLEISLGADTISLLLIGLTILLGPICVLASYTAITHRIKTYYAWLLVLQAAMTGVFCARDIILFYIFFEFTLVPLYILINLYGSTNRRAAATKFFLFTFTGSIIALAGLVYIAWFQATQPGGRVWTFDFQQLRDAAHRMAPATQAWVFWALMIGFAVKVPLFPLHTWLPLAHTEAPTAGSVILAGVLLKLGTYGIYRFAIGFCPVAAVQFAPVIATLAIIGILYGGLVCWVQTDVKKLVAYSSVSHLGFCMLGMFALGTIGLSGSVLYMLNHGLSTGALFLMIGMIYERYHTRSMKELGGLASKMPVWSTFMVFFVLASVGLPGLNGFVSEFLCLLGAFQSGPRWADSAVAAGVAGSLGPWYAAIAGVGMIITAIYLLFMVGKVVWGTLVEPHGHGGHGSSDDGESHAGALPTDLCAREIILLAPIAILCLALGLYPTPVLRALESPTRQTATLIEQARRTLAAAPADIPVLADQAVSAVANPSQEEPRR